MSSFALASPADAPLVQWTTSPYVGDDDAPLFMKLVDWNVHTARDYHGMVRLYEALRCHNNDAAEPLPSSLLKASLSYGYSRVLVRTPFVDAVAATDAEITGCAATSPLAKAIADALSWLLMHDVVYTDLRGANVLKPVHAGYAAAAAAGAASSSASSGSWSAAVLVDYDDAKHYPGCAASC